MATITVSIATSSDDGRWRSGSFSNNGGDTYIGGSGNAGFFRFTGLSVLHGATITSASIEFVAAGTESDAAAFIVKARAADNPSAPTTESQAKTATRHATTVLWNSVPSFTAGSTYTTPSLTSLIQALSTDGYLASGVALIYVEPNGTTGQRDVASYDHATYAAAKLTVDYVSTFNKSASDSDTVSVTDAGAVAATLAASDSDTIGVTETAQVDVVVSVTASDSGTISGTDAVVGIGLATSDSDTVSASESVSISAGVAGSDSDSASGVDASSGAVTLSSTDSDTVSVSGETIHIALAAADSDTVSGVESDTERRIIPITYDPRLAVDVYDLAGNRLGAGPIVGILSAEYGQRLDELGDWRLTVNATEQNAEQLVRGREVRIRREGEGLLFRGIVDVPTITVGALDDRILEVSGLSVGEQMVWANTLLGRTFAGSSVATVATSLLSGTGWTNGTIDSGTLVSARFDGVSVWAALREVAQIQGWHVREDVLNRTIDLGAFGTDSGLVIRAIEAPDTDLAVVPLAGLRIIGDEPGLWNRVIPLGAGEGVNQLTLRWATRTTPYTIKTATGPDGNPYWYLEDTASIAAYGARTIVLPMTEIAPISNSAAEIRNAANALYDVASAWLDYHANPAEFYAADVVLLRHIEAGAPTFKIGQTARLQWSGVVEDADGRRLWRSVDANVWIMGYRRSFNTDGSDSWSLDLATVDRHAEGAGDRIVQAIEDLWALKTAMKPYSYREIHGPTRQSVDATHDAEIPVDYDDTVTYLHRAELRITKHRVRSNVSTTSAGGGQTSSATATTATSGGGQTSSGGTAHTHSIAAQTTSYTGEHSHQIGQYNATSSWTDPAYMQQLVFTTSMGGALNYGVYVGRNGTEGSTGTLWTAGYTNHSHDIAATTSVAESSHTHTISAHTHSINAHSHTVSDHTHALSYGIYEGPTASTPAFTISINGTDRTAALGGPWNGDTVLDITPYLVDADGHVLRQRNSVVIGATQLCDVELVVKSWVTALSLIPV